MFRAGWAFAFVVLACGALFSQQPAAGGSLATSASPEIRCPGGWRIPGVIGSLEEIMESNEVELPGILPPPERRVARYALSNIPGVFLTKMQPGIPSMPAVLLYCPSGHPGPLVKEENRVIIVLRLWRFDFKGKVFAYDLEWTPATHPPVLEAGQVVFYDVDGKGIFTVARIPKLHDMPEVPKWAKEGAGGTGLESTSSPAPRDRP